MTELAVPLVSTLHKGNDTTPRHASLYFEHAPLVSGNSQENGYE